MKYPSTLDLLLAGIAAIIVLCVIGLSTSGATTSPVVEALASEATVQFVPQGD
jgi:hypothetical protein